MTTLEMRDILLVEDSPSDQLLAQAALKNEPIPVRLHIVADGSQALAFLRREPPFTDAPRPELLLLDLNLPKKDGRTVLDEVKSDPNLSMIPIIVLTTSLSDDDVRQAYRSGANCYVVKPLDYEHFRAVIRSLCNFWFEHVRLPPRP